MIKVGNVYTCNIVDKVINYNFNSQFFRYKGLFFFSIFTQTTSPSPPSLKAKERENYI